MISEPCVSTETSPGIAGLAFIEEAPCAPAAERYPRIGAYGYTSSQNTGNMIYNANHIRKHISSNSNDALASIQLNKNESSKELVRRLQPQQRVVAQYGFDESRGLLPKPRPAVGPSALSQQSIAGHGPWHTRQTCRTCTSHRNSGSGSNFGRFRVSAQVQSKTGW